MLWAYVDDSNIHDRQTGTPLHVGHGGGIAPYENWKRLEVEWKAALEAENVPAFHMTDFEARRDIFTGWPNKRREGFLNCLLDIIDRNVEGLVGYSVPSSPEKTFPQSQAASVGRMLYYCTEMAIAKGERKIHLVFARQPQVKIGRIASTIEEYGHLFPEIASFTGASPSDCPALQAADLLAYELVRWRGVPDLMNARYPIRTLMARPSRPCRVFHAFAV